MNNGLPSRDSAISWRACGSSTSTKAFSLRPVFDASFVKLELNGIVAIEIEFGLERGIRRDFQVAGAIEKGIVQVDVQSSLR